MSYVRPWLISAYSSSYMHRSLPTLGLATYHNVISCLRINQSWLVLALTSGSKVAWGCMSLNPTAGCLCLHDPLLLAPGCLVPDSGSLEGNLSILSLVKVFLLVRLYLDRTAPPGIKRTAPDGLSKRQGIAPRRLQAAQLARASWKLVRMANYRDYLPARMFSRLILVQIQNGQKSLSWASFSWVSRNLWCSSFLSVPQYNVFTCYPGLKLHYTYVITALRLDVSSSNITYQQVAPYVWLS
jgi:hypothetical protein